MMTHEAESVKVGTEACPSCRAQGKDNSGDNLVRYSDGHGYCFACEHYEKGNGESVGRAASAAPASFKVRRGEIAPLPERSLDIKAVRAYGYQSLRNDNGEFQIANYFNDGTLVAQHVRQTLKINRCPETGSVTEEVPVKDFFWLGKPSQAELWGQHLWREGGKKLVITEGEIDCLTMSQLQGVKYPVVSIGGGAAGAVKEIKRNLQFVNSYDEVILMFDMDDAGQAAASKVADILPPGKCKIAKLPMKDANECLVKGFSADVIKAFWEAKMSSPDEILHASDIDIFSEKKKQKVWPFPWPQLTKSTLGQRSGELNLYASGTGSGKSTFVRELAYNHLKQGRGVGMIMLEESPTETMEDLMTLLTNKPIRKILMQRELDATMAELGEEKIDCGVIDDVSENEMREAQAWLHGQNLHIYDHQGANGLANILKRCETLAVANDVEVIIIDHVTAAATDLMSNASKDTEGGSSERLIIDALMKDLRALAVRTGVHIDVISQLKKGDKAFEEGYRITLQDLKGAGSLSSVPNGVFVLERNRQLEDERASNTSTIRALKSRAGMKEGILTALYYNSETGRMEETDWQTDDNGNVTFDPGIDEIDF